MARNSYFTVHTNTACREICTTFVSQNVEVATFTSCFLVSYTDVTVVFLLLL